MQVNISARHGQLSEATRGKISDKMEKLTRLFERVTAIEVTVNLEHQEKPEVDIRVDAEHKHDFRATDCSENLMASVDGAMHKLEQQLRKYKEKVQERHRAPSPKQFGADVAPEPDSLRG